MLSRVATAVALVVFVCSVVRAADPSGNVIRPRAVDAEVAGCKVSQPGEYRITVGDVIEIEYTYPVVPDAIPKTVDREWDRGAIFGSELGIRNLIVPEMVGTGTYLFYFVAKIEGSGTAFAIVDGVKYEYRFTVAAAPPTATATKVKFTAFYNAVETENGAHLLVVGWCNEAGWRPVLKKDPKTSTFSLSFQPTGDHSAQVITPFAVTAKIPDPPKSIHVKDAHGEHQVRVYEMESAGSGANKPAVWVKSS